MELVLFGIGLFLVLLGVLGSFLPILPGLPLCWLGLVVLYFIPNLETDWLFLIATFVFMVVIGFLDYWIPAYGTKRFGGSNQGAWGAIVGLFVGILLPIPFGMFVGTFVGAFVGEVLVHRTQNKLALRAAFGSFLGMVVSTLMKFLVTIGFLVLFIYKVIENKHIIF